MTAVIIMLETARWTTAFMMLGTVSDSCNHDVGDSQKDSGNHGVGDSQKDSDIHDVGTVMGQW